jgi:glycosyltransferase involved in cell wall biosynthesis
VPKVSVIIPTYNRVEALGRAIKSVLAQNFQDFEIIVIDDAPQGYAQEVIASFDDQRIKYIRHDVNKGDGASRNTGILNSRGDYLAFLDDDDEWLPNKLQMQIDVLTNSPAKVGGVYTGTQIVDGAIGKILRTYIPKGGVSSFEEICTISIATSSVMLKRECFEKVGLFDEAIPYCSDYDMWVRISKEFELACIKEPLVKYSAVGNKISNDYEKVIKGSEILISKYDKLFARNRKSYSHFYLSLGVLYCYSGNIARGREVLLTAIKIYPFELRHYFNLCLSLLGARNFKKLKTLKEAIFS